MKRVSLLDVKVGNMRKQSSKVENVYKVNCKQCNKAMARSDAISGNILKMGPFMYHRKCLNCATCKGSLSVKCAFVSSRSIGFQCSNCHLAQNAPKCHSCKKPTFESCVKAFETFWHRDCFKCKGCDRPVKGTEYVVHEGFAYDEDCYYRVVRKIVTEKQTDEIT